jgi:hypothetical protein
VEARVRMKLKAALIAGCVALVCVALPLAAFADPPRHGHHDRDRHYRGDHYRGDHYRGPSVRGRIVIRPRYHHHPNYDRWRRGRWYHGWHGGTLGWWWIVGPDFWFYYSTPVYPYPVYTPYPSYPAYPAYPPAQDYQTPSGPPPEQYWYYCDNPKGYYPYVGECPTGWRAVPATPPPQ